MTARARFSEGRCPLNRLRFLLALGICISPLVLTANADVRVQVMETDPASPATLKNGESFYLRIQYETDRAIRIRGEAYFAGQKITDMTGGSPRYQPGTGEAMFWFAWRQPAQVDRIVILAQDDSGRQVFAETKIPVQLTWSRELDTAPRARAEWVQRMRVEDARRVQAELEEYRNRPGRAWETLLGMAIVWCVPAYFVAQILTLVRWRERWRFAAGLPLIVLAPVLLYTVYAYLQGSNIFPLVLIFTSPVLLMYLGVLWAIRRSRLRAA